MIVAILIAALLVNPVAAVAGGATDDLEARADAAWAGRADGATPDVVPRGPVLEAIEGYRAMLAAAPDRLDVRIKLLRAIVFLGEYATPESADRKPIFEDGRLVFEDGIAQLEKNLGVALAKRGPEELPALLAGTPDAGALYFYGALQWGFLGRYFGKMASLRQGLARKIRDLGETAILLDPRYDGGAGYRLIGRLHAEAPRVPLVTGWVSHARAVQYLEKALELGPQEPLNRLFLAEAYLDDRTRRAKAIELLREAAAMPPRPELELEDRRASRDAAALLRTLEK